MAGSEPFTDHELFNLIATGDEAAFKALYHRYGPLLLPTVSGIIKSESLARDVVQEVFLRVWLNRDMLEEIQSPKAWLFRISYYQAYTHLRKKGVYDKHQEKFAYEQPGVTSEDIVEFSIQARDTGRLIKEAISALSPQERKIYILSREKDMKIAEIAEQLDLSVQTVKNTLYRALKSIRAYLSRHGVIISLELLYCLMF